MYFDIGVHSEIDRSLIIKNQHNQHSRCGGPPPEVLSSMTESSTALDVLCGRLFQIHVRQAARETVAMVTQSSRITAIKGDLVGEKHQWRRNGGAE